GHAIREYARQSGDGWRPKIVQFVSPQVWASRPGRARRLARDYDLLLSIFPFEKNWYAERTPELNVEFVGHPMVGRFASDRRRVSGTLAEVTSLSRRPPRIVLLPGSRKSELQRHLPVLLPALALIRKEFPDAQVRMVLPDKDLAQLAEALGADVKIQLGDLPGALAQADLAIASTGTVTMECAWFGVPTVTLYRAPMLGMARAAGIIKAKWFTMPNLLANEELYPEFLAGAATSENLAGAAIGLLRDEGRRRRIKSQLEKVMTTLGGVGAPRRAAEAIRKLFR
ncbi:MAG TPA: lipid-A-disaccharide synthase, partial [Verrucomicrobiae bacterium]|nr:lipid-A-disaccharide synthase [Verrucomicrobiae bacterium]